VEKSTRREDGILIYVRGGGKKKKGAPPGLSWSGRKRQAMLQATRPKKERGGKKREFGSAGKKKGKKKKRTTERLPSLCGGRGKKGFENVQGLDLTLKKPGTALGGEKKQRHTIAGPDMGGALVDQGEGREKKGKTGVLVPGRGREKRGNGYETGYNGGGEKEEAFSRRMWGKKKHLRGEYQEGKKKKREILGTRRGMKERKRDAGCLFSNRGKGSRRIRFGKGKKKKKGPPTNPRLYSPEGGGVEEKKKARQRTGPAYLEGAQRKKKKKGGRAAAWFRSKNRGKGKKKASAFRQISQPEWGGGEKKMGPSAPLLTGWGGRGKKKIGVALNCLREGKDRAVVPNAGLLGKGKKRSCWNACFREMKKKKKTNYPLGLRRPGPGRRKKVQKPCPRPRHPRGGETLAPRKVSDEKERSGNIIRLSV